MANHQTQFSCILPVGPGNVEAALAIYERTQDELEADDLEIGFEAEPHGDDNDALWLSDGSGSGDVEQIISFALQCAERFDLRGTWGFHWSLSCDRPRINSFGGGAQVLDLGRRECVAWIDCEHWVAARSGAGDHSTVLAETILEPVAEAEGWTEATQMGVLLGFIDKLIANDHSVADQLRADLAEVVAVADETDCRECGRPMFIADGGTSHHVGDGPDGIDYGRDRDHTAVAEPAVSP